MQKPAYKSSIFISLFFLLFLFPGESILATAEIETPLPPPSFSHEGGFYGHSVSLQLSTDIDGAEIYYTLDGSVPDPANLTGTDYNYKNIWIQRYGDTDGDMLTGSYTTRLYSSALSIVNRQNESDRLTQKASSYHNPPYYIPSSPVYKGTVVRAISVKEGYAPSEVVTHTYFIGNRTRYDLPVISITTSEDNLFDYDRGIYTPGVVFDNWRQNNPYVEADGGRPGNYHLRGEEWEYPAHFAFWDSGSTVPDLSQDIGFRIHGGWSRAQPMKTLRLYARSLYGKSTLEYPFFPEQDYGEYKRIILRNSGNDNPNTMFRDALIQRVCRELNFDTQAYRPVVVFLNGEYWGIHNIRERYDKHYIKRVYGVEGEDLDLLTGMYWRKEGDNHHYVETINYIEENGLQEDEHYQYIKTRIDTENFIDYQIANIYSANTDWPANNIDFWRKRTESYQPHTPYGHDGRWRWMAFDMDFGFGIWGKSADENVMTFATATDGPGWPNPPWATFLLRSFLENESFTADFLNRFAGLLNTSFRPERVISLLEEYESALEPEMPEHIARWKQPVSMDHSGGWQWNSWLHQVSFMRNFANERPGYQWGHLMAYFDLDTVPVTLDVSSPGQGYIRINDVDIIPSTPGISEDPYPWTGTYFSGTPIVFEAVPLEGYRFSHWEGTAAGEPVFTADPAEAAMITAYFERAPQKDIIHLWHFNDLPGDDLPQSLVTDYSAGETGVLSYPGEGAGFMDRVDDGTQINLQEGSEPGYGLRVRNPTHNRELVFSVPSTGFDSLELSYAARRTPNGAWNQTVYVSADGGGSWSPAGETIVVSEDWQRVLLDLSGFPQLGDNADVQIKILFGGETASGESGNNRFDNITLRGRFLYEHTSYYNKSTGSLNETSSWGSEPDGSGQSPASFDAPGAVYHIQNGDELTISGNWAVSGMLSRVVLGDGSDTVTFTIPPGYSYAGKMNIEDGATLVMQNPVIPELDSVSLFSTVVFEQDEVVIIPARTWGSLHLKGGTKVFSGNYLVAGSFTAEDTGLSFAGPTTLTLKGDLGYPGSVSTLYPENVNILATGTGDQLFWAGAGNRVDAYNFYVEKSGGSFSMAADIHARNNLRLDFSGRSLFDDGGHTLQLGDDLRIRGNQNRYRFTGTILLTPETGTNDIELSDVPLHNLVIDATGDARVDFNDATPVIRINNDLTIRSRSSRPLRLRDRRFVIRGDLLLDVEEPEQVEQGESLLVFNGESLQVLKNKGYGGTGLLHGLVVNGGGLQLEGSVTIDSLIGLTKGMVLTDPESILKLGPGGTISQASTHSYVNGPMGIYGNSRETTVFEFPVGKENGMRRVVLEAGHESDNLRLYTAEYFDEAPPKHELGAGITKILENHGFYSIETDREGEITTASISISYADEAYPADSITIVKEKDGVWVCIGSEPVPEQWKRIKSTSGIRQAGIFALALKKDSPLSTPVTERIFNVYPNPVPENGTIVLPEVMDVTMVNSSGITVLSGENMLTLKLEGIPPGIYILKNRQGWHARIIIAARR
jgi:hypothetical protein